MTSCNIFFYSKKEKLINKNRHIFKNFKPYFLKSQQRILILHEKFKKDIKEGFISKNSIQEYETYFSECLSDKKVNKTRPDVNNSQSFDTARIRKELGVTTNKKDHNDMSCDYMMLYDTHQTQHLKENEDVQIYDCQIVEQADMDEQKFMRRKLTAQNIEINPISYQPSSLQINSPKKTENKYIQDFFVDKEDNQHKATRYLSSSHIGQQPPLETFEKGGFSKSQNIQFNSDLKMKPRIDRLTFENDSEVKRTSRIYNNQLLDTQENKKVKKTEMMSNRKSSQKSQGSNDKKYKNTITNAEDIIKNIKLNVEKKIQLQMNDVEDRANSAYKSKDSDFKSKEQYPPRYNSSKRKAKFANSSHKQNSREIHTDIGSTVERVRPNMMASSIISQVRQSFEIENFDVKVCLSTERNRSNSLATRCITVKNIPDVHSIESDKYQYDEFADDDINHDLLTFNNEQINFEKNNENVLKEIKFAHSTNLPLQPVSMSQIQTKQVFQQQNLGTNDKNNLENQFKSHRTYDYSEVPSDYTPVSKKDNFYGKNSRNENMNMNLPTPSQCPDKSGYTSLEFLTPMTLNKQMKFSKNDHIIYSNFVNN